MAVNYLEHTERLIEEINQIHAQYSADYFETGKVAKANLSRTFDHVPIEHILSYRLNLHESINDYLFFADIKDIHYKINRYLARENQYPVNNILNDIFGARMILPSEWISEILNHLDEYKEKYQLQNWYLRDVDGYIGIHIYFKNSSNFYYPWELQI